MQSNINILVEEYGLDVVDNMEKQLANELAKSIDEEIILDVMSPETKGLPNDVRWKSVRRINAIETVLNSN